LRTCARHADPGGTILKTILLALALVATATILPVAAAAPEDPCPNHCTPPYPCGWAPDVRKDPVGYANWAVRCVKRVVGEAEIGPVLP
jgi:hypothetical protein